MYPRTVISNSAGRTQYPQASGADDTAALQAALHSGKPLVLAGGGRYTVSAPLRITQSGQTVHLSGSIISALGVSTSIFLIGENANGRFVKTDDVLIAGPGTLQGQADGKGRQPPFAIGVTAPPATPYTSGGGCSRITIRDVRETGFCFGLIATGADNLLVENFTLGGNVYYKSLEAGGYGILLQTCFQSRILHPTAVATGTDRHAIYVSADPRRPFNDANTCKGVVIRDADIDWSGVHGKGPTQLEAPLVVRSAQDLTISGGVVKGGYGGIDYVADNGPGKNVVINGVIFRGQIAGKHSRACIDITRFSGRFVTDTVTISGCTIEPSGPNMYGIVLSAVNNIAVNGNV